MKKYIFYKLVKHASQNVHRAQSPWPRKSLKYLAAFAFLGTIFLGGLAIWGTVAVVNSIASSVNPAAIQENVAKGQDGLMAIASQPLMTKNCLDTIGGMLSPTKILTVPLAKNIDSIRSACSDQTKATETHQKQT